MLDDLAAFLTARLDELKAAALKAAGADRKFGGRPHWLAPGHGLVTDAADPDWAVVDLGPCIDDDALAGHIVLNDPASVLRDVEADRKLIAEYEAENPAEGPSYFFGLWVAIRIRAERFSDHPDYRPEWKP